MSLKTPHYCQVNPHILLLLLITFCCLIPETEQSVDIVGFTGGFVKMQYMRAQSVAVKQTDVKSDGGQNTYTVLKVLQNASVSFNMLPKI